MNILKYSLIRILLFAAFLGLFYAVGMRSYMAVGAAIICGAMANYIFFPTSTRKAAESLEHMTGHKNRTCTADSEEDQLIDDVELENRSDKEQ